MPGQTVPVVSSSDGPRLTISQITGMPRFVPERVLRDLRDEFLVEAVLRQGPPATSGAVAWEESAPLFADGEPEEIAEGGEVPIVSTSRGLSRSMATTKRGFGLQITQEMRRRNNVNELERRMRLLRNTMVRAWDNLFTDVILNHTGVHTLAAAEPWYGDSWEAPGAQTRGRSIRYDISQAELLITESTPDEVERPDDFFGFRPDVLIIPQQAAVGFKDSDSVNEVFAHGVVADQQLRYTGKMPKRFYGHNVLVSRTLPNDVAVMLERDTTGFVSDEWALEGTPLEYMARKQTWESYFTRRSVAGLDQPKSCTIITGIRDTGV